jgi:hypothetical protein
MANSESNFKRAAEKVQKELSEKSPQVPTTEAVVETPVEATAEVAATEQPAIESPVKDDPIQKLLSEVGVKSVDELKEWKNKLAPKEEEKQPSEDEVEAAVIDFGVKKGRKIDEFHKARDVQSKTDRDLVFEKFASKEKAKHPNITDEKIEHLFNKKYHLEEIDTDLYDEDSASELKMLREVGEDALKEEAESIRESFLRPVKETKSAFEEFTKNQKREETILKEFRTEYFDKVPDKFPFQIGESETIEYEIEPEYKRELQQKLFNAYHFFKTNPQEGANQEFDLNGMIRFHILNDRFSNIYNIGVKERIDTAVREALKPYKNPIEKSKEIGVSDVPKFSPQEGARKMGDALRHMRGV